MATCSMSMHVLQAIGWVVIASRHPACHHLPLQCQNRRHAAPPGRPYCRSFLNASQEAYMHQIAHSNGAVWHDGCQQLIQVQQTLKSACCTEAVFASTGGCNDFLPPVQAPPACRCSCFHQSCYSHAPSTLPLAFVKHEQCSVLYSAAALHTTVKTERRPQPHNHKEGHQGWNQ